MIAYGEECWIRDLWRRFSFGTREQAWSLKSRVLLKWKGTENASDIDIRRGTESARILIAAAAAAKSLQLCLTLCDPIDGSPPGSPVPGTLQARTLEWVAISFSSAGKWKVKVKALSRVRLLATPWTAAYQAPSSMGFSRQEYWSGVPLPSPYFDRGCIKSVDCLE